MKRWDPRVEDFFPQSAMDQDEISRYTLGIDRFNLSLSLFFLHHLLILFFQGCTTSISINNWVRIRLKII